MTNEGKKTDRRALLRRRLCHPAVACPQTSAASTRNTARPRPARAGPTTGPTNTTDDINGKKNLNGEGNYVFLEATGRGHFVGVTHAVEQNQDGWFGEGDDMIFIDGDTMPTINGTGTEDYYNGAWDFNGQPFAYMHNGAPYIVDPSASAAAIVSIAGTPKARSPSRSRSA